MLNNKIMTIQEKYKDKCKHKSDINELLPILKDYADRCDHVTEMGVRYFVSTYAFLYSTAKNVVGIDIEAQMEQFNECKQLCELENKSFKYIIGDTLNIDIDETDFLFIDTWHEYGQLKSELNRHHSKVSKYIGFHDTTTYAHIGETQYWNVKASGGFSQSNKGLMDAINEFLVSNPEWVIDLRLKNNNGLTILKRN